jgi:hypothetical protein
LNLTGHDEATNTLVYKHFCGEKRMDRWCTKQEKTWIYLKKTLKAAGLHLN